MGSGMLHLVTWSNKTHGEIVVGIVFGALGIIVLIGFGILQLMATFAGLAHWLGDGWAWVAMILAMHPLVLVAGAFYGSAYAWGWEWYWALLFAMPALLMLVPTVLAGIWETIRR